MLCTEVSETTKRSMHRNLIRAGCLSLLIFATPWTSGCASTPANSDTSMNRELSFWPQFPSEPRMQFLVAYRYSSDIEAPKSKFESMIYGKESDVLPITKPYGVEMWDGKIYVCDIKNPGVVVLDLAKHQTRVMATRGLGGMVQPTDIAITPDGMKYVTDSVRGVIFVFDAEERQVNSFGHKGFKPVGIAAHENKLYVTDFATQSVVVMDRTDGSVLQRIGGPGGDDGMFIRPLGIDVDREGDIYVSDAIKCRLQKFSPQGQLISAIGQISDTAGSFVRPKHVAVDPSGVVYVVDAAFDNVQMFDDEGRVLMFFGSGGEHPGSMNLPAGISVTDRNLEFFEGYIHPSFQAERLVLITNQFGPNKVAVYAMGKLKEGKTVKDIATVVSEMSSGVLDEGEANFLTDDLPSEDEGTQGEGVPEDMTDSPS